jgi:hypothetical protein
MEDYRDRDGVYVREPSSDHPGLCFSLSAREDLAAKAQRQISAGSRQVVPAAGSRKRPRCRPHRRISPSRELIIVLLKQVHSFADGIRPADVEFLLERILEASPQQKLAIFQRAFFFRPAAAMIPLFDHLVGTQLHPTRNRKAERICGLQVDDQLELRGLLYRKVRRLFALEYPTGVDAH